VVKILLVLILLGGLGFYFYRNGWPGSGPRIEIASDGSSLKLPTVQGGTATFTIGDGFEGAYMLMGANEGCNDVRGSCGSLTVLPLDIATSLARRYPDFRRCSSAGAAAGKANTYDFRVLVPDSKTEKSLHQVVQDHEQRVRAAGTWSCVTLRGSSVEFVQAEMHGATVTAAQVPKPPSNALKQYFLLLKAVEPRECPPLT
jgi:hypothetical protein